MVTPASFFQNLITWALSHGIKIVFILIAVFIVDRIGAVVIRRLVRRAINGADGNAEKKREDTLISIFVSSFKFAVWIIAVTTILPELGVNIGPLLAGAGLVGLAIGMGARSLIQDYLSGIFIILENQYAVGDSVKVANVEGRVREITLRRTILEDQEGAIHSIPNGQIKTTSNRSKKA